MNTIVTGASGHLGANLVRSLISRGWNVKALVHHDTRALQGLDVELIPGNILDSESLEKAFTGADTVFHLAARISVVTCDHHQVYSMNVDGVRNVVDACLKTGVRRLVHTSSFHARNQYPLDEPLDEDRPLVEGNGHPPYNRTKAEGERIVYSAISRGLDPVIVVPTGIIGPWDFVPSHFGATILNIARRKLPVLVDAGLDWVDARDVAGGMITAAEKAKTGESFILSGHWASLKEITGMISRHLSCNLPGFCVPMSLAKVYAPVAFTINKLRNKRQLFTPVSLAELKSNPQLSHKKATLELGYEPRSTEESITDTLDWFIENGHLSKKGTDPS